MLVLGLDNLRRRVAARADPAKMAITQTSENPNMTESPNMTENSNVTVNPMTMMNTEAPVFDIYAAPFFQRVLKARRVLLPVAVVLGVFGNVMTIVVISTMTSHKSSSLDSFYCALAVSDLCVVLAGPLPKTIADFFDYDMYKAHVVPCKVLHYSYNAAGAISAWLLVALTTQRTLSVTWPHRVSSACTTGRIRLVIAAVVAVFGLLYSHILYGVGIVSSGRCDVISASYNDFLTSFAKVDLVLFSWLPFLVLAVTNTIMIRRLRETLALPELNAFSDLKTRRARKVNSVTLTALTVSLTFMVLTMPMAVANLFTISFTFHPTDADGYVRLQSLKVLGFVCAYFNCSLNFYLYFLTGERFRAEFRQLFTTAWCR